MENAIFILLAVTAISLNFYRGFNETVWYKRPGHFAMMGWAFGVTYLHFTKGSTSFYDFLVFAVVVALFHLIPWLFHKLGFNPED